MPPNVPQFSTPNLGALIQQPNPMLQFLQAAAQIPQAMQQHKADQLQQQLAQQLMQQNQLSLQQQQQTMQQNQQSYAGQRATQILQQINARTAGGGASQATPQEAAMLQQASGLTGQQYLNADGSPNLNLIKQDFAAQGTNDQQSFWAMTPDQRRVAARNFYNLPQGYDDPKKYPIYISPENKARIAEADSLANLHGAQTNQIDVLLPGKKQLQAAQVARDVATVDQGWARIHQQTQRIALEAQRVQIAAQRATTPAGQKTAEMMLRQGVASYEKAYGIYQGGIDQLNQFYQKAGITNGSITDLINSPQIASNPTLQSQIFALAQKVSDAKQTLESAKQQIDMTSSTLSQNPGYTGLLKAVSGLPTFVAPSGGSTAAGNPQYPGP